MATAVSSTISEVHADLCGTLIQDSRVTLLGNDATIACIIIIKINVESGSYV